VCTYTVLINMSTLPLKCQLEHIPLVICSLWTWIAFLPQDLDCLSPLGLQLHDFLFCCIYEILDINSCIQDEIRSLQTFHVSSSGVMALSSSLPIQLASN